jgi:hypothetical protein
VFTVYLLLVIIIVFGVARHRDNYLLKPGDFLGGFNLLFVILFTSVSRLIFGSLVEQTTFPVPPQEGAGSDRPTSLFGYARRPTDAPDERDMAVRNWAYFQSFRMVAVYAVLLWLVYLVLNISMVQISLNIAALLLFPLIAMATTLPQAVLLWSEPDLPAPDEELSSAAAR